jgi:hypothetical protein
MYMYIYIYIYIYIVFENISISMKKVDSKKDRNFQNEHDMSQQDPKNIIFLQLPILMEFQLVSSVFMIITNSILLLLFLRVF